MTTIKLGNQGKAAQGSPGMTAMGVFLIFGATMAFLAGTTLVWPGSALDRMWELNPRAYRQLVPLGRLVGIAFLFLAITMAVAGIGWFKRKLWGWWLAVAIITTQVLGDLGNALMGHVFEGLFGATIAGGLLLYLFWAPVRAAFRKQ